MAPQQIHLDSFQLRRSDTSVRLVYCPSSHSWYTDIIEGLFSTPCLCSNCTSSILTSFDRNCSNVTSLYYVDDGIAFWGPTSTYSTQPPIYTDPSSQPYVETWTYIYNPCFPTMSVPTVCLSLMNERII